MEERIIALDVSSSNIKIALLSSKLELVSSLSRPVKVYSEDIDGFARRFDMEEIWLQIQSGLEELIRKNDPEKISIIGISSCAQRIAAVFVDDMGREIYGGPNSDVRGIDSAYLIDDAFTEKDLFEITGHSPTLIFPLARLLWFKEEEENTFEKIHKVLSLDDWLIYKLSGIFCTDLSSAAETQFIDIKKGAWSSEIINTFDLDPDLFPDIIPSGSVIGELKINLVNKLELKQNKIPIIKTGGDTQATLLGMGVIEEGDIGISLGTTAPVHLVVDRPIIDSDYNFWTTFHTISGKYLIEGNPGYTGTVYDFFKQSFLTDDQNEANSLMEIFLKETQPGSFCTYAFLGPEHMNIKNQASIKRGVFVFQPPTLISDETPNIKHFARSVVENIAFGIYENHLKIRNFTEKETNTHCAGGMAKSDEFLKLLANVLNTRIKSPVIKDSAYLGMGMNVLKALNYDQDIKRIFDNNIKFEIIPVEEPLAKQYREIFIDWKNLKNKVDKL